MLDCTDAALHLIRNDWRLTDQGWLSPFAIPGDVLYSSVRSALLAHEAWTGWLVEPTLEGASGYVAMGV